MAKWAYIAVLQACIVRPGYEKRSEIWPEFSAMQEVVDGANTNE
ncbi:hypothetical protein thalar_02204 [Litoreibacter arenae DSM 19593]|uniref:Uncharacterized protein n=1 Tax=Litoreibacter arenae DSM 19593 TaxID=1123360 RepID=S9RZG4_9RHOB|nr:hypothetical protein thalar_02204 [Litoreibacter arenae DSM 19593]